jgi:hypothetical protein
MRIIPDPADDETICVTWVNLAGTPSRYFKLILIVCALTGLMILKIRSFQDTVGMVDAIGSEKESFEGSTTQEIALEE